MRARPILFSAPMVRALIEGRKTQTRRVVSEKNLLGGPPEKWLLKQCPYGKPGDLLWVRETYALENTLEYHGEVEKPKDRPFKDCEEFWVIPHYRATEPDAMILEPDESTNDFIKTKWRPAIHMPLWASRLTLQIKNIRIERLQDISVKDVIEEGIRFKKVKDKIFYELFGWVDEIGEPVYACEYARETYRDIWESLHGKTSWKENPWVWVIEFDVHKVNVDEFLRAR